MEAHRQVRSESAGVLLRQPRVNFRRSLRHAQRLLPPPQLAVEGALVVEAHRQVRLESAGVLLRQPLVNLRRPLRSAQRVLAPPQRAVIAAQDAEDSGSLRVVSRRNRHGLKPPFMLDNSDACQGYAALRNQGFNRGQLICSPLLERGREPRLDHPKFAQGMKVDHGSQQRVPGLWSRAFQYRFDRLNGQYWLLPQHCYGEGLGQEIGSKRHEQSGTSLGLAQEAGDVIAMLSWLSVGVATGSGV